MQRLDSIRSIKSFEEKKRKSKKKVNCDQIGMINISIGFNDHLDLLSFD